MKPKSILAALALLLISSSSFSQLDSAKKKEPKITQMTVMVIPRTNENEDVRTVLDRSESKRIAVATIKQAFDRLGFRTIDFVARLNAAKTNMAFTSANPRDAKAMIIELSGTDMYVEADVIISRYTNEAKIAIVGLECKDASSAFVFGINSCKSPPIAVDSILLVERAANDAKCLPNFMSSLEAGWADIRENGRPLKMLISPSASCPVNLLTRLKSGNKDITTLITDWLENNTVNSNYVVNGSTKLLLDLDDVRVTVLDSKGKNYRPVFFGRALADYLSSAGVSAESEVKNGTIYVTITSAK